jgi:hypothetical protein
VFKLVGGRLVNLFYEALHVSLTINRVIGKFSTQKNSNRVLFARFVIIRIMIANLLIKKKKKKG